MGEQMPKLLVLILTVGLLLAGCGGDEDNGDGTGTSASSSGSSGSDSDNSNTPSDSSETVGSSNAGEIGKAEFVDEANQICRGVITKVTRAVDPIVREELGDKPEFDPKSEEERENVESRLVLEVMVPALRQELDELRALGIPSGDEKQLNVIYKSFEGLIAEAENKADEVVKYGNTAMNKPTELAEQYGLNRCPYG
jgi:hypothetical protein